METPTCEKPNITPHLGPSCQPFPIKNPEKAMMKKIYDVFSHDFGVLFLQDTNPRAAVLCYPQNDVQGCG